MYLESEQDKWLRGDRQAEARLPDNVRPIYIHDREADAFSCFNELTTELSDDGFIVRASQNRCIRTPSGDEDKLFDWSSELDERGQLTIQIEQGGNREAREADLSISADTCHLLPPVKSTDGSDPIEVNVVRVDEIDRDEDPIQWVLLTSEPIEEVADLTTVIEYYQARWVIEE